MLIDFFFFTLELCYSYRNQILLLFSVHSLFKLVLDKSYYLWLGRCLLQFFLFLF